MSSYLDKIYPGKKGGTGHTVYRAVTSAAVYGGASYGFGYVQNRWRGKASLLGVPVDLLAGSVLSAVALGCDLFDVAGGLQPIVRDVGHAGLGAYFHTLGAGKGAQHSGVARLLLPKSDLAKAKAALPNATVLGDIPRAPRGDVLSAADLAEMAR